MKRLTTILIMMIITVSQALASFGDRFYLTKMYPFFSDVKAEWDADADADEYEVVCGDQKIITQQPSVHFRRLKMDTEYEITVTKLKSGQRGGQATAVFRTGLVKELANGNVDRINRGPTHVTMEFSDVSGSSLYQWPATGEAYEIQLFAEKNTDSKPLYSFYSFDGTVAGVGVFCITSLAGKSAGTAIDHPLRISFGRLRPETTYWARVRVVGGVEVPNCYIKKTDDRGRVISGEGGGEYEPQTVVMSSPRGYSDFSEMVALTTAPAHTPVEGEILYEGFDDLTFGPDYFNVARGLVPKYKKKASSRTMRQELPGVSPFSWTGEWGPVSFSIEPPVTDWGGASKGKFPNGRTSVTTTINRNFNVFVFGKDAGTLYNWSMNWNPIPAMGAIRLTGNARNKGGASFIATPELKDGISRKGTKCLLTFKMCPYIQTKPEKIRIERYCSEDDVMQYIGSVEIAPAISDISNYNLVESNCWQYVEVEITLFPYDALMIFNDTSTSVLVDDICIRKL